MEHRPFRSRRANKRVLIATNVVLLVATLVAIVPSVIGHAARAASADGGGLGQLSGLLPRDHLTLESAIQVDLTHETVRPGGGAWPEGMVHPHGCNRCRPGA